MPSLFSTEQPTLGNSHLSSRLRQLQALPVYMQPSSSPAPFGQSSIMEI
jgi:hypothetical protein